MRSIQFFYDGVPFRLKGIRAIKLWIEGAIKAEGKQLANISVIFCTDAALLQINTNYLKHETLTDIITFDFTEEQGFLEGEIYISIERVSENAAKFSTSFDCELERVLIHGVLHLIGYSDKNSAQKRVMRKKENQYLSLRRPHALL
jgi:probable rRNA maturation factor